MTQQELQFVKFANTLDLTHRELDWKQLYIWQTLKKSILPPHLYSIFIK